MDSFLQDVRYGIRQLLRRAGSSTLAVVTLALGIATRAIQSFLFQTSPVDPLTLAAVTALLITSGILAALWPARQASRVDPVASLRAE